MRSAPETRGARQRHLQSPEPFLRAVLQARHPHRCSQSQRDSLVHVSVNPPTAILRVSSARGGGKVGSSRCVVRMARPRRPRLFTQLLPSRSIPHVVRRQHVPRTRAERQRTHFGDGSEDFSFIGARGARRTRSPPHPPRAMATPQRVDALLAGWCGGADRGARSSGTVDVGEGTQSLVKKKYVVAGPDRRQRRTCPTGSTVFAWWSTTRAGREGR